MALLRKGRPQDIGPLFSVSHASIRDDVEISGAELDLAVGLTSAAQGRVKLVATVQRPLA